MVGSFERALGASDEYLAYVLEVLAYERPWPLYLAALPNVRRAYRFLTMRMRMSAAEKAEMLERLLARRPARLALAIEGLPPGALRLRLSRLLPPRVAGASVGGEASG